MIKFASRMQTNGIIWCVIAGLQIVIGLFLNWLFLIIGALNIISAIKDLQYSKQVAKHPIGIVKKVEPIAMPVIGLIYNLVIGGIIGVIGSIYYFVAIRGFVMENKTQFLSMESENAFLNQM